MSMLQLTSDQLVRISGLVAEYINQQRDAFSPRAFELSENQKCAFRAFFPADLIDHTRFCVLNGERVPNPVFYPDLAALGLRDLPDFTREMNAVTFENIVVSHVPFTNRLLFHELVHVVQYAQLGVKRFSELYVGGFLSGGGYHGIPLEIQAYTLDSRFALSPKVGFSVSDQVRNSIMQESY